MTRKYASFAVLLVSDALAVALAFLSAYLLRTEVLIRVFPEFFSDRLPVVFDMFINRWYVIFILLGRFRLRGPVHQAARLLGGNPPPPEKHDHGLRPDHDGHLRHPGIFPLFPADRRPGLAPELVLPSPLPPHDQVGSLPPRDLEQAGDHHRLDRGDGQGHPGDQVRRDDGLPDRRLPDRRPEPDRRKSLGRPGPRPLRRHRDLEGRHRLRGHHRHVPQHPQKHPDPSDEIVGRRQRNHPLHPPDGRPDHDRHRDRKYRQDPLPGRPEKPSQAVEHPP